MGDYCLWRMRHDGRRSVDAIRRFSMPNALPCRGMADQLPVGRGHLMPLKKEGLAASKMAWLGQNLSSKPLAEPQNAVDEQERLQEIFKKVSEAEKERIDKQLEMDRKVALQIDREQEQLELWRTFHKRLSGALRGTHLDPEPGQNIAFSKFWKLLEAGKVEYVEYANYGQHIAVLLPHFVDGKAADEPARKLVVKDGVTVVEQRPVVYRRHWVDKMPGDCMSDVWKLLHPQLKDIKVIKTNTIANQLYPQAKIVTVWGMRVALAASVFFFLKWSLSYFTRFRDPLDRGWNVERDLTAGNYVLGALGESRARFLSAEEKTGVTFDDFAGQDYIKAELQEVVKLLKESKEDPTVYVPKGVLLHGPPGTGKTLLARAIAGEAGLPFFSVGGAEFVEMYAGVAAARVQDLFSRARNFAPSIIFIDEIDAIGGKRGNYDVGGGGREREQGLIQMLTELDGFQSGLTSSRVLVIGATNRLDMLDAALLRKGRFDKIMAVGLPSEAGRLEILKVHAKNKPFKSEEEKLRLLKDITKLTNRFSGAELANILNEAVILAIRHDKEFIEKAELEEAISRQGGSFATGQEDVLDQTGEARTRLAYREAAVAVLDCYFPNPHTPFIKTNIRKMDTTVNMQYAEPPDFVYSKKQEYVDAAVRLCAPRIVEELIFGRDNTSWLSGSFLGQAGALIDRLIFQTGFTALGKTYYKTRKDVLVHLNPKIQALRDEYMRYAIEKCTSVLLEYRSALETMADRLMEKTELQAADMWEVFNKSPRIPQPVVYPVDEYDALIYEGRWGIYGASLPGRASYYPGNVGYATFGAPKPRQVQRVSDEAWEYMDKRIKQNKENLDKLLETEEGRRFYEDDLQQRVMLSDYYYL
ncbi:probable inactive ATP-dependent zinc metalloprotease FTSHI 4, chloroplastic [Selaginella moellendorffii]|uniref:probable inactive ATP-dependent zinc metalloprotease FTSHI 4, chloroplastic n=1 Tax=Selaginella moellendorffii TaxID=88036 RepID=UPI000D1D05DC|nr:probable inactive ATP-dependent zinc metalloprotease FTSHI 4, chloroplastic [Selaginella moellendorffii]|eukprot:XP_024517746.1 probable inactive ATP-dependent zinc metalloprotease FTSHI 4, chloroplastic [Selaginella moellendorffii]